MSGRFISMDDMINCAKRELAMRKAVYPRQLSRGRISQGVADHEIDCMEAILNHLNKAAGRTE